MTESDQWQSRWDESVANDVKESAQALASVALGTSSSDDTPREASPGTTIPDPLGFGNIDISTLNIIHASSAQGREGNKGGTTSSASGDKAAPLAKRKTMKESAQDLSASSRLEVLPTSEHFNPESYLQQLHADRSANELEEGLQFLKKAQMETSERLQNLVHEHFKRFVDFRNTMYQVHGQLHGNEGSKDPDAPASANLGAALDEALDEAAKNFGPVVSWQEEAEERRKAATLLDGFRWLFNLPHRLREHIRSGDLESASREYANACDIIHDDNVSLVRRILEVSGEEIRKLTVTLRNSLKDSKISEGQALAIIYHLRELESVLEHCHPDAAPPKADPLMAFLFAQGESVQNEIQSIYERSRASIFRLEGAKHARKKSVERWRHEGAEQSTRNQIDFKRLLGEDSKGTSQLGQVGASAALAEGCDFHHWNTAQVRVDFVRDVCDKLRSYLPSIWKFVLSERYSEDEHGQPIQPLPSNMSTGTPLAPNSRRPKRRSRLPTEEDIVMTIHDCLAQASNSIEDMMSRLLREPGNENSFRKCLACIQSCIGSLSAEEPPEGALQQLHKLYAWGLDELTTQYAQRLRDEASLMRQTQGDKVDRLSRVISEIADNAAYEVESVSGFLRSTESENALLSMQRKFFDAFTKMAGEIEESIPKVDHGGKPSWNHHGAGMGLNEPGVSRRALAQAEEMFVEESSKNALLKLLANCINIRCNLLELLASRFADVRGEYGYYIDTRGRKEAGAALAKVEENLLSSYFVHKKHDFAPLVRAFLDAEDLRIAGDQDDGVRESVHAIVTAVETMHSEMQRQGVDGEDYKRRAVDVVVQLIETESSRPRLGDLSTPAYAQLSFELESLIKVFGLSWSRGSGATLRQVLERGLESCKDMRAAGEEAHRKASKLGDSDIRAFSLR